MARLVYNIKVNLRVKGPDIYRVVQKSDTPVLI